MPSPAYRPSTRLPRLRPAHRGDAVALQALIEQSFDTLTASHYSAAQRRAALGSAIRLDPRLVDQGRLWVAADDQGRLLGCAGWTDQIDALHRRLVNPRGELPTALLRSVFVHPRAAGLGLGRRLVATAERLARESGAQRLLVLSTANAAAMYAHLGYLPVQPVSLDLDGAPALEAQLMSKLLWFSPARRPKPPHELPNGAAA